MRTLDALHKAYTITELAHGATPTRTGADWFADEWSALRGVPLRRFPPILALDGDWPGAGNARNRRMLKVFQPDLLIAYPGQNGTANCVEEAQRLKIEVWDLRWQIH